jgi:hypothetical protein
LSPVWRFELGWEKKSNRGFRWAYECMVFPGLWLHSVHGTVLCCSTMIVKSLSLQLTIFGQNCLACFVAYVVMSLLSCASARMGWVMNWFGRAFHPGYIHWKTQQGAARSKPDCALLWILMNKHIQPGGTLAVCRLWKMVRHRHACRHAERGGQADYVSQPQWTSIEDLE